MSKKKEKSYTQAEIADLFQLIKHAKPTATMSNWLNTKCELNQNEHYLFDKIIQRALDNIDSWNEEELKMKFISFVLQLSNIEESREIRTFFEKTIQATVEGIFLKTKTDFMIAKGLLDLVKTPYFHFQEYKKEKEPNNDPLGQLLEAFLIAQSMNQNNKPIYGAYIVGRYWYFVTMENKEYCVSKSYDSTQEDDLMQIIAILRHFKVILETVLLVD